MFAGFAPVEDPEVTVVVVLDEPLEYKAGFTAAPVFSEIAARTLGILGVPKTR
ncbi:MAG: penicillin-binding transpeptidase domain-containing protein [Acidimicrobiales bacterium]